MDIDGLVREWFYELPKGYADAPYSQEELAVLDEVLAKHNISLNEFSRSSDRDEIERFVMSNPKFEDKSPRELDQLIDELEDEWDNVHDNYKNIDDYFEELEKTGGLENLTEVDPLDQAFNDAKPIKEDDNKNSELWDLLLQKLIDEKVFSESGTYQDVLDFTEKTFLQLPPSEAKQVAEKFRTYSVGEFVANGWETFIKFMSFDRKGFGRGELAALMGVKGSQSGGTAEHDLKVGGTTIEIKEVVGTSIRPAKSGMAARMPWSKRCRSLYTDAVLPIMEDTYITDALKQLFPEDKQLNVLMDMFADGKEFSTVSSKGTRLYGAGGVERGLSDMSNLYNGLTKAQSILTDKFLEDKSITAMSLSGATKGKFVIGDEDVESLQDVPVDGKEVTINVVPVKTESVVEANLWLYNLRNHPWVQDPQLFITELVQARDIYFASIPSGKIMWFQTTSKNKIPKQMGISEKDEWYTTHITQGQMRYAPKSLFNATKYPFVQLQKGS